MIPSLNEGDQATICDCCRNELRNFKALEIGGVKYFVCTPDCARTLFFIHHQYAMREVPQEGRFAKLPDGGWLDLDKVSRMVVEYCDVKGFKVVRWWLSDPTKYNGFEMPPEEAEAFIAAWKKRPSLPPPREDR